MSVNYCSRTVERLPRISRGLVDIECRENDSITFECKLNITQETDIRWQKDGKVCFLNQIVLCMVQDFNDSTSINILYNISIICT